MFILFPGAWANDINQLVGVSVPLVAMKHAYVVTEKIPGIENMPNVRDHDASVYLKLQGDALQVGGYEVDPIFIEKLDKDFAFGSVSKYPMVSCILSREGVPRKV